MKPEIIRSSDLPETQNSSRRGQQDHFNYWRALHAERGTLALCFFLCLGLSIIIDLATSPTYQAQATLELRNSAVAPVATPHDSNSPTPEQTFEGYMSDQIGILQSRALVHQVVDRLAMEQRLNQVPRSFAVVLRRRLGITRHVGKISRDNAYEIAEANLIVRQARLSNLIEVVYSSEDPKLSADFVNTLVDEYSRSNLAASSRMSKTVEGWLANQATALREKLEAAERELQRYSKENHLSIAIDNSTLSVERLRQLQAEVSQAQATRIQKQTQSAMALENPDSVPQLLDDPTLREYDVRLTDLKRQQAEFDEIYTPSATKSMLVAAQIKKIESLIDKRKAVVLEGITKEYNSAVKNEQVLFEQYQAQSATVDDEDARKIRFDTLKHEADIDRGMYDSLLQRMKEASVTAALQSTNIYVVDEANAPAKPFKPNHVLDLSAGALVGILAGLICVILTYRSRSRIKMLSQVLAARELAVIPNGRTFELTNQDSNRAFGTKVLPRIGWSRRDNAPEADLKAWLTPLAVMGDSFRGLMTSILFSASERRPLRIIVVTSPNPGDGKTTVASNLAVAFAQAGRRVLLVDADVRQARIHRIFGVSNWPGLVEFGNHLAAGSRSALETSVRGTDIPNLFVMPSGGESGVFALLNTDGVTNALRSIGPEYETVIVDSAPLLQIPETRALARFADGVILVLRAGKTDPEDALSAERIVAQDGGRLLGTVLNDAPISITPYKSDRYSARYRTA